MFSLMSYSLLHVTRLEGTRKHVVLPLMSAWMTDTFSLHSAAQFTPAPPTCPGDTITFTCTVNGTMFGTTLWRVASSTRFCSLPHISTGTVGQCGPDSLYTATPVTGFGDENATSFTSTLSARADPTHNGFLVECFGPFSSTASGNMVGSSNIQIIGTYTSCYRYTCCMNMHVQVMREPIFPL